MSRTGATPAGLGTTSFHSCSIRRCRPGLKRYDVRRLDGEQPRRRDLSKECRHPHARDGERADGPRILAQLPHLEMVRGLEQQPRQEERKEQFFRDGKSAQRATTNRNSEVPWSGIRAPSSTSCSRQVLPLV